MSIHPPSRNETASGILGASQAAAVANLAAGNLGGQSVASIAALVSGVNATGSVTFPTFANLVNGDTLIIGGQTFTAWASGGAPTAPYVDVRSGVASAQDVAVAFAAAINAEPTNTTTAGAPVAGVMRWTAKTQGTAGNVIPTGTLVGRVGAGATENNNGVASMLVADLVNGYLTLAGAFPFVFDVRTSHIIGCGGSNIGFGSDGHVSLQVGGTGEAGYILMSLIGGFTGIGLENINPVSTLHVRDNRTVGNQITRLYVQEGANQTTNEAFGVYANDGTTPRFTVANGKVGIGCAALATTPTFGTVQPNLQVAGGQDNPATCQIKMFPAGASWVFWEMGRECLSTGRFMLRDETAERFTVLNSGRVGISTIAPTASLHLPAGVAAASGAPLKIPSGVVLTNPEAGAIESDGTHLYWTNNSLSRRQLDI